MDFFNIPSELSKANSPAYKSGLLKLYAKGGFTGRSDYKRSIENDIRVGMYEDGGSKESLVKPRARLNFVNPTGEIGYQGDLNRGPLSVGLRGYTDIMRPLQTQLSPSIGLHGRMGDIDASYDFARNQVDFNARYGGDKFSIEGNAQLNQGQLMRAGIDSRYQVTPDLSFEGNLNWNPEAPHPLGYNLGVSYRKKFAEGGKSGDPTDEELAAAQLRYNQMTPAYSKAKEEYEKELKRVSDIRSNVVSEADKINRADDQYRDAFITEDFSKYPKGYLEFINAKNPQELEEARKNLPEDVRNLLPSDGKYTVAQWNPQTNSWKKGAEPNRELYCTPYGCFAYQKAGATDVPIVPGNVGFEAMAKSGKLPFKKIDPTQREPGDVGLMVELAPADYINNQTLIRRPHHTGIYAQPDIDDAENTEKGFFFNAIDGNRLMYDVSLLETNQDPKDRIDYYRYVGQTEKLKSELDKMESERQRLQNFLSQAYKERTLPSRPINAIPNSMAPQPSQPIQLFGKGGYRVVRTSERKGKTHKVIGPGGKVKYFGDPSMGERSKSKYGKEAFYKRHAKNLKANPYFRAYARATWSEGGIVRDVEPFNLSSY